MISPISAAGCFNSPGRCFLSRFSENRKVFGLSCGEQRVPAGGGTWPVGGSGGLWCPRAEVTPAPSSGSAGWGSHQGVLCRGVDVPGGWTEALPAPHPIPEDFSSVVSPGCRSGCASWGGRCSWAHRAMGNLLLAGFVPVCPRPKFPVLTDFLPSPGPAAPFPHPSCSVPTQPPLPSRVQLLQQEAAGELLPEGRGNVPLQPARHQGPGGGTEMRQRLPGGGRGL